MPVINSYDKPAIEIKFGNYLFGQKVVATKPKLKKTTITLDAPVDGRTEWEFRFEDMLEVGVEERTPEEQAEKDAEMTRELERHFVRRVNEYIDAGEAAPVEAAETRAKRAAAGRQHLDYSTINRELEAYAKADLASDLRKHIEYFMSKGDDEFAACKTAVEAQADMFVKLAMRMRVLSRSTSMTANLCEDLQLAALAEFLNSMQYNGLDIDIPARY